MNADANDKPIPLVINADDFGFFTSVSKGIYTCAREGAITATGVMANGPEFSTLAEWLRDLHHIDIGAHLNLTYGKPVSREMRRILNGCGGSFQTKYNTARLIMGRRIPHYTIMQEWRAQIERCLAAGLRLRFINSHEHIHLLPPLTKIIQTLAKEYQINYIRYPQPEWGGIPNAGNLFRNILLYVLSRMNGRNTSERQIGMIGVSASGRLSLSDLKRRFMDLDSGKAYELMCHPGYFDPEEIRDKNLIKFHDWESEIKLLRGDNIKALMKEYNIRPVTFRELSKNGQPVSYNNRNPLRKNSGTEPAARF